MRDTETPIYTKEEATEEPSIHENYSSFDDGELSDKRSVY
jgi:hypothetical protein